MPLGNRSTYFFLSLVLLVTACTPSAEYLRDQQKRTLLEKRSVRVLIDTTNRDITLSSDSRIKITDVKSGRKTHERQSGSILINPSTLSDPVVAESFSGIISYNGTPYSGEIRLVPVMGRVHVVNIVEMEKYLQSVVPSEVISGWHREALRAQAVAARTYAYYHLINNNSGNRQWDLDATVNFQVYRGMSVETKATTSAVMDTAGEIIMHDGRPIIAYFHSSCGGGTVDGKNVWSGSDFPYLSGISCSYCRESPHYKWETTLSLDDIRDAVAGRYKTVSRINSISFRRTGNRVSEVIIVHPNGTLTLGGNEFRLMFLPQMIRSMNFRAKRSGSSLVLYGGGWGHGVGMCQWGAQGLAERGMNYRRILGYYYRSTRIEKYQIEDRRYIADSK